MDWGYIMDKILEYLQVSAFDSIKLLFEMSIIIFAVMLVIEVLKAFHILNKINNFTFKFTKHLGITPSANFPLLVGLLIGISYGAGAIIASYNNNDMTKKDVLLVSVFLCICHALIEDTILFMKIGANGFVLVFVRLITAIVVTLIIKNTYAKKEEYNEGS